MKSTMLIKPDPTSTSSLTTASTTCGNCGVEERRLLHHIRHRSIFRRLCTTCVLRLHPQSFCPTCFTVYHPSPPPLNDAVTCSKCYSSSHSHCVGPNHPNPYICPNCINPNSPIFTIKKAKDVGIDGGEEEYRVIDRNSARVLLAAARIAAFSMSKAAVAARVEAERRAKEAAFTRKRAREALEHLAYLVAKEKLKKKEVAATVVGTVRNVKRMNGGNNNDVVAALNAVELREGDKTGELLKVDSSNDVVGMDVEEGNDGNVDRNNVSNGDAVVISADEQLHPMNGSGH